MQLCISQATVLDSPFEADADVISRAGWPMVEIWLTKLETYLQKEPLERARELYESAGLRLAAASGQGGLLLTQGEERKVHWDHLRRRLDWLAALGVPRLVIAPDAAREAAPADFSRAVQSLAETAALAAPYHIQIALEFQRGSAVCSCLETALALIAQTGAANLGVCLDVFHYYVGPSKFEDLAYLTPANLAWVQLSDLAGVPRELARDGDRILPGDGDFQLAPILEHLRRLGYQGGVSLEVLNPRLWQVAADRVADLGLQAVERLLAPAAEPSRISQRGQ